MELYLIYSISDRDGWKYGIEVLMEKDKRQITIVKYIY